MLCSVCDANFSKPSGGVNIFLNKISIKTVFSKFRVTTTTTPCNSQANWPDFRPVSHFCGCQPKLGPILLTVITQLKKLAPAQPGLFGRTQAIYWRCSSKI